MALLCILMPVGIAAWTSYDSSKAVKQTIEAAAEVAKQLKAVQDAARNGHTMLPPDQQTGVRFANNITGGTP